MYYAGPKEERSKERHKHTISERLHTDSTTSPKRG